LIAPSELRKQGTWNAGQTRVKRELLVETNGTSKPRDFYRSADFEISKLQDFKI
jgi:hypothetical protein